MGIELLKKALINHANGFGPIMNMKGSVNIEYLAGIEIICNRFTNDPLYLKPLPEKVIQYVPYESNGCDCGQMSCPTCHG